MVLKFENIIDLFRNICNCEMLAKLKIFCLNILVLILKYVITVLAKCRFRKIYKIRPKVNINGNNELKLMNVCIGLNKIDKYIHKYYIFNSTSLEAYYMGLSIGKQRAIILTAIKITIILELLRFATLSVWDTPIIRYLMVDFTYVLGNKTLFSMAIWCALSVILLFNFTITLFEYKHKFYGLNLLYDIVRLPMALALNILGLIRLYLIIINY